MKKLLSIFVLCLAATITRADPPKDAIILFDGKDTSHWRTKDGGECPWTVVDRALQVKAHTGDIFTRDNYEDYTLHVEFRTPTPAPDDKGQHRGNSGVFLQGAYEIQILESFGLEPTNGDCASIYSIRAPDKNVARPPLEWQTYDITYRAPRFDASGNKTEAARVTVIWNGTKVHDNVEIPTPTRDHKAKETPGPGPIELQDHGFAVEFRNIWIVPAAR